MQAVRDAHLPDLIAGDLDSIRPDVVEFYKAVRPGVGRRLWRRSPGGGGARRLASGAPVAPRCHSSRLRGVAEQTTLPPRPAPAQRGVPLLDLSADQMTNDLTKCVKAIEELRAARGLPKPFTIIAAGAREEDGGLFWR